MTLEDLGNVGDFLGGIGVIVTLIYLAIQIHSNTRTVRSASLESVASSHSQFLDRLASDPELTRIWFSGLSAATDLTPDQAQRFILLLMSALRRWESAFHNVQSGTIEHSSWQGLNLEYINVFASAGVAERWPVIRTALSPAFLPFAEDAIRNHSLRDPRNSKRLDTPVSK
jgi:hypothetical protein